MRLGFSARLALVFAMLVAATALLITAAGARSTNRQVYGDVDRFLADRAAEITSGQRPPPGNRNNNNGKSNNNDTNNNGDAGDVTGSALSDAVRATGQSVDPDAVVQALDEDGNVLSSVGMPLPVDATDVRLASRKDSAVTRTVVIEGVDYRIRTEHLDGGGAIQVARSLAETSNLLGSIRNRLLMIGLGLALGAAVVGWLIARQATKPLRRLTESVERVAATQDLSVAMDSAAVNASGSDEVARLADGFDHMLGALRESKLQQQRLVQDAAHELRTPLTSLQANADLLAHAPDLPEQARQETVASIKSELTQLRIAFAEIVELATDVRDRDPFVPIDLADPVHAAVARFQVRSDSPTDIEVSGWPVHGDAVALERAVANLLSNAQKYSPPGSRISVSLRGGEVRVRDRGPGISAEDQGRVFDRFYRSQQARAQQGSGLGLAIVKKVVDDHGGEVWVADAPDGGAEVGFRIPAAPASTAAGASQLGGSD